MTEAAEEIRRLRWQCRRGLLELDLLFQRFLATRYGELTPDERLAFRTLLSQPDPVLMSWFQGQENPPDILRKIIRIVSQYIEYINK